MDTKLLLSLYEPPMRPPRELRFKLLLSQLPTLIIPESSVPLTEFTIFPELPHHLRLRIWHLVAFEPRYIKLIALSRHLPACYQGWDSEVAGQPRCPGMLDTCHESRDVGVLYYTRIFEKIQQLPENKDLKWTGTQLDLILAKRNSQLTNGAEILVNFSRDIFIHVQCSETAHESRSENPHDYNFKPRLLQYIQRLQQIYNENLGMPFPLLLICIARIRDYGLEMGEDSKEVIKGLTGVERDIHMRMFDHNLRLALLQNFGDKLLRVPLSRWKMELR